jgi:hypothetical protein
MNRLMQIVIITFSLLFFISAQAGVGLPIKECVIFADEATDDSKKEGGEKPEGGTGEEEEEEEEPDCD